MSVIIEALNVVVPIKRIESKYPGGLKNYERDCPNGTYCADEHITRAGFMVPADVSKFVERLVAHGLVFYDGREFVDIAVIDQNEGPTAPCSWLEIGLHMDGFTFASLKGTDPNSIFAPVDWSPARTTELHFVSSEEIAERLLPLARNGSTDVVLDYKTGKQVHVDRAYPDAKVEHPHADVNEMERSTSPQVLMPPTMTYDPETLGAILATALLRELQDGAPKSLADEFAEFAHPHNLHRFYSETYQFFLVPYQIAILTEAPPESQRVREKLSETALEFANAQLKEVGARPILLQEWQPQLEARFDEYTRMPPTLETTRVGRRGSSEELIMRFLKNLGTLEVLMPAPLSQRAHSFFALSLPFANQIIQAYRKSVRS